MNFIKYKTCHNQNADKKRPLKQKKKNEIGKYKKNTYSKKRRHQSVEKLEMELQNIAREEKHSNFIAELFSR
jgi:hypothetical protein